MHMSGLMQVALSRSGVPPATMQAVRILVASDSLWQTKQSSVSAFDSPVTQENEQATLQVSMHCTSSGFQFLRRFPA